MSEQEEKAIKVIEKGISRAIRNVIAFVLVVWLITNYISGNYDRNSSDGKKRSGMILHTDALTGCQYLSKSFFSPLLPRKAADGVSHQGCRKGRFTEQ